MEHPSPRAYLAGPTVFLPDALSRGIQLTALCKIHGLEGIFPPAVSFAPVQHDLHAAAQLFSINISLLNECDLVIADFSPFRGPHVDDGTAFEAGFAYALKKPIFAYSHDLRQLLERIPGTRDTFGAYRDQFGLEIENFGQPHNLMLMNSAHALCSTAEEAIIAAVNFIRSSK